jgi:transcription-repair coupling factor (superfamily II helicase)
VVTQNSRDAESLCDEIAFFAGPSLPVRVFPDLETLPYDSFSAHPDITSARLATLAELPRARSGVWLVAADTLLQRLAPRSYVEAHSLKVHVGESLDLEALRARLTLAGYAAVTQVVAHGEFAVRGSLLDVFPMGSDTPYRIDLLDRDVETIRHFDPDTQRSGDKLERIQLLPARETPVNPDSVREFRRRYRSALHRRPGRTGHVPGRERGPGARRRGILPAPVLRPNLAFIRISAAHQHPRRHATRPAPPSTAFGRHCRAARTAASRSLPPILDPAELYLPPAEFRAAFDAWPRIELRSFEWPPETRGPYKTLPAPRRPVVRIDARAENRPPNSPRTLPRAPRAY